MKKDIIKHFTYKSISDSGLSPTLVTKIEIKIYRLANTSLVTLMTNNEKSYNILLNNISRINYFMIRYLDNHIPLVVIKKDDPWNINIDIVSKWLDKKSKEIMRKRNEK